MAARIVAYLVACIVGVTLIAGLIVRAQREDDGAVDLIVINAKVYAADGEADLREAVAVRGNKVIRVGTNREIQRLKRAQTIVIDAKGGAVVPGFNDAHTNLIDGGLAMDQANLSQATTLEAMKDTVQVWAEAHPEREWIIGRGWDYESFPGGLPTRQLLDTLIPDRPAYLTSFDGHTGWANSKALKLAGITRRTKNPANGAVVKDPRNGEPTGVLKEEAMSLMAAVAPQPTREDRLAAIRASLGEAHHYGVTSVQNTSGSPDDLELYGELRKHDELTVRIYQALSVDAATTEADLARLDQVRARFSDDPLLKTGALTLTADGAIATRSAAMLEPYAGKPVTSGEPRFTPEALNKTVGMLDRRDWQVMTRATGDAAIRMTLDAYQAAAAANPAPARGRRHRIEYVDSADSADLPRFAKLGVIASMQPLRALAGTGPGGVWSANLGPERAAHGWLWGSISSAGGHLAFGSDWPSSTFDPRYALQVSVNRDAPDGMVVGSWRPGERMPLRKAIDAYTRDAAWASFDEQRKGTLTRDMLADLVIFTGDIFARPAARLTDAQVAVTIVDGKVVYRRDAPSENTIEK